MVDFNSNLYGPTKVFNIEDALKIKFCLSCHNPLGENEECLHPPCKNYKIDNKKGLKFDDGKIRLGLVFKGFANALLKVGEVGTFGANKYTDNGWQSVPRANERYTDAGLRHLFADFIGEDKDPESEILHLAHNAWNALAILEFKIKEAK